MNEDWQLDDRYSVESSQDFLDRNYNEIDDIKRLMSACDHCGEFRTKEEIRKNGGTCNLCADPQFSEKRGISGQASSNMKFFHEGPEYY